MNFTSEQLALQAHIEASNAGNEFCQVVSDPDHWAEYGITTIEQYDHFMAVEYYCNVYKDVNGIRPRWMDFDSFTAAEIEAMAAQL